MNRSIDERSEREEMRCGNKVGLSPTSQFRANSLNTHSAACTQRKGISSCTERRYTNTASCNESAQQKQRERKRTQFSNKNDNNNNNKTNQFTCYDKRISSQRLRECLFGERRAREVCSWTTAFFPSFAAFLKAFLNRNEYAHNSAHTRYRSHRN